MSTNKNESSVIAFLQGVEVPDIVEEKAGEAFRQIYKAGEMSSINERETGKSRNRRRRIRERSFVMPKVAVIIGCCFLAFGTTAAAIGIGSLYRQRMENMDEGIKDEYYEIAEKGETTSYSRRLTEEEKQRYKQLEEDYEKNGRFPTGQIASLKAGQTYNGEGVVLDEDSRTLCLPKESLSDEEMLEMIDFEHKLVYSIYAKQQARILEGGNWESRMVEMTDEMVDRIYYITCSTREPSSGGFNRTLTKEEEQRYETLVRAYEDEGKYVDMEMDVIDKPEEYTGEGAAVCVEDGNYYIPEGEVTDEEFLQVIDMQHKVPYCLDRIYYEVLIGLRSGYPARAYDDEVQDNETIGLREEHERLIQQKLMEEQKLLEEHQKKNSDSD